MDQSLLQKDGTVYIALLQCESSDNWELIHWGKPVGLSDVLGREQWCNQLGFGLKLIKVLRAIPLDYVINHGE